MNSLLYFLLLLKGSLFSMSGLGNVPSVHADFIARRWATNSEFAEAITVGQVSPGPNGLWVISLGYLTHGLQGALLALAAILIPPVLVVVVDKFYQHVHHHPAVEGFVYSLALSAVSIFIWVLFGLLQSVGISGRTIGVTFAAFALATNKHIPAIVILSLAAAVGLALH